MSFIEVFRRKGYFYQCTDLQHLEVLVGRNKITAYIGFDCTAASLHVGSLMQIMILRLLQQMGHKVIVVVGGATSRIGDPSGKDQARKALSTEEIIHNSVGIKRSLSKFIKFGDEKDDAIMLDNSEWLSSLGYLDFLHDFGRVFSVNRMFSMESVKLRLERQQHLSFLEFNYTILQAYDFYHLNKSYQCSLQLGGSDQWGNIVMGVDLVKKLTGQDAFGLTTPLLVTSSGVKMGKSIAGAVWLNEDMTSPYDYYQYWRNCEDPDVIRFAELYSEFSDSELEEFRKLVQLDINKAKKQLAFCLTKLCHGEQNALSVEQTSMQLFEQDAIDDNLPTVLLQPQRLADGICAFELFYEAGLAASKSEARNLIRGKGARINNHTISDEKMLINHTFLVDGGAIKLSAGKKKHMLVRVG